MDGDNTPTLTQCPFCLGHGRRHISGSMRLDEWGVWDANLCPLCKGKGMVAFAEAEYWRRRHLTPADR